jgi:lysophospholipase L1-like esterase
LGLSGISLTTKDTLASISIQLNDGNILYDFNSVKVFHLFGDECFEPKIENSHLLRVMAYPDKSYTLFEFDTCINNVVLKVNKKQMEQKEFTLMGVSFDSNKSGIVYHTIGVNGATVKSYLRCEYFEQNLSVLNPDWVIVSLGTNDSYVNDFDSVSFYKDLNKMVSNIKNVAPNSAILLTTPGDNRIDKKTYNKNVILASNIIKRVVEEQKISYWDFNTIMGGAESINLWYAEGLVHTDYLHFTIKGYKYQSQLMFNAFLKSYSRFLD